MILFVLLVHHARFLLLPLLAPFSIALPTSPQKVSSLGGFFCPRFSYFNGRAGGPPVSDAIALTRGAVAALVVSCAMGVAMSYFAFKTRNLVSATAFAVIGNACKILSVAINVAIWDQHANALGVAWLLMCLAAAYFYKPAPLRSERDGPSAGKGAPSTASAADSAASRA